MKLYNLDKYRFVEDKSSIPIIGEIEDEVALFRVYKINGRYYTPGSINHKDGYVGVHEVSMNHCPDKDEYESNLKCPYCGVIESDAWELDHEDDEYICGRCGAVYSYEKIVSVDYSISPVRPPDIIETEFI